MWFSHHALTTAELSLDLTSAESRVIAADQLLKGVEEGFLSRPLY